MKIFSTITTLFSIALSCGASADGYVCQTAQSNLRLALYNSISPKVGTRVPATLIVSSPRGFQLATAVKFFRNQGALRSHTGISGTNGDFRSLYVTGTVNDQNMDPFASVLGVPMTQVSGILLRIDHSINQPVPAGSIVSGQVFIFGQDRQVTTSRGVRCIRYLKGQN